MTSKTTLSILVLMMAILALPPAEAATITVGPEGCDHSSIQEAIDAARPGDVVSVQNGTYRETLVVDKPIALRDAGDGTDRPIVDASRGGSAVTLLADGATIEGFVLENGGFGWAGIEVRSKENAIRGNLITDNRWYGIYLDGAEGCVIEENVIWNNKYGIWINAGSSGNLVRKNVLQYNENRNAFDLGTNLWEGNFYGDYAGSRPFYEVGGLSNVDRSPSGPEEAEIEPPTEEDAARSGSAMEAISGGEAGSQDPALMPDPAPSGGGGAAPREEGLNQTEIDPMNRSTVESPPSNLTVEAPAAPESRKRHQISIIELSQSRSGSQEGEAKEAEVKEEEEEEAPIDPFGPAAGDGIVDADRGEEETNESAGEPPAEEPVDEPPEVTLYTAGDWTRWGDSLLGSGRYPEAITCYERALEIDPANAAAWAGKGDGLMMTGRYDKALRSYERALEIDPASAAGWCRKGNALQMLLRFEDAMACYNEALRIDPEFAEAWNRRGSTLNRLGRYSEALECFDRALEIDPGLVSAWSSKSWALQMLGEDEAAKEAFDRARGLG